MGSRPGRDGVPIISAFLSFDRPLDLHPLGAVDDRLTARAYHQLWLGLLPHSRAQQTSALALLGAPFLNDR
jgi:hypothetical protein